MASFDFEEQETNPTDVPRYWYRAQATRGTEAAQRFPAWTEAKLTYTAEGGLAYEGLGSVELPTRGGNTALTLSPGVVPVFSDADYLVSCKVQTRRMRHAAAFIVARLLDQAGKVIEGAEFRSPPARSEGSWTRLSVGVPGSVARAAYLQVELLVLQPHEFAPSSLGQHQIWSEDFNASAFFDLVEVSQPPRVELSTHDGSNIILAGEAPEIVATVRDLTGESLTSKLRLLDIQGREVDATSMEVGAGLHGQSWKPRTTGYGWYRCVLDVFAGGVRVGGSFLDLAYVKEVPEGLPHLQDPDDAATRQFRADRDRLGIALLDGSADSLAMLPGIAARLDAKHLSLPVLTQALTPQTLAAHTKSLMRTIDLLLADGRQMTLCLGPVPSSIAESLHLSPRDAWAFAQADRTIWTPYVTTLMDRYGQRVNHWQIGRYEDAFGSEASPSLMTDAMKVQRELSTLVAGARVLIPVEAAASLLPGPAPATVGTTVATDPVSSPEQLAAYFKSIGTASVGSIPDSLVLRNLPIDDYGRVAAAAECVKRLVMFWQHGLSSESQSDGIRLDLAQPWTVDRMRTPRVSPSVEIPAWINAANRLCGRRIAGTFPAPNGVVCLILVPATEALASRGGALVLWNETARSQDSFLQSPLGQGDLRVVDLFGNSTPAPMTRSTLGGEEVRVQATRDPVFIEGIDVNLARFLAGLTLAPTLLESSNSRHDLELTIENPWPTGLSGTITILQPGGSDAATRDRGWRVSPRTFSVSVPAGEVARLPFTVSFSPAEEMGPKDFVMEVKLSADKPYKAFELTRQVQVGMADLSLDLTSISRGEDLIIEAAVSNKGSASRTLALTAYAPDQPRSKATINDLAGGTQTIRRFSYKGSRAQLAGKRIVVAVGDPVNDAQLTRSIEISEP